MNRSAKATASRIEPWVLGFACLLPTAVTYFYFDLFANTPAQVQQLVYAVGKVVQFSLPVVWVGLFLRKRLWRPGVTGRGIALGTAFGIASGGAGVAIYYLWLRGLPDMALATTAIQEKVAGLGIDSPIRFAALGVFYAVAHSLLEEYYWRWFVYRRLRAWSGVPVAAAVSSVAFTTHHVLVLNRYFSHAPWLTALLSVSVLVGGLLWALLYERSQSLLGPWLSHLLIDAAIFAIGFFIVFGG